MPCYVEFAENHVVEGKIKAVLPSMSFYESHRRRPIYYSGPPRNSSLSTKVKRFAFKTVLWCKGGDLSAVVPGASRRSRTFSCLRVGR